MNDLLQERIIHLLVTAGIQGVTPTKFHQHLGWEASAAVINQELEFLLAQDKVQKFEIHGIGRVKTIWRATTKILDDIESKTQAPRPRAPKVKAKKVAPRASRKA